MAGNVTANAGSGGHTFGTDLIGGVDYPQSKIMWGPDGTVNNADIASGKGLPVQLRDSTGTEIVPLTTAAFAALLGAKTDAKDSHTDATSITFMQVIKQISAYLSGLVLAAGSAIIGKVGIDQTTPGTTNLVALAANQSVNLTQVVGTAAAVGSGVNGAGVQRVSLATDDLVVTKLTSLISPGLTASVTVTRPSDTTPYTANDVLGPTGAGTSGIDLNLAAISGSNILITGVALERDVAALISGEAGYNLYLYSVTPPSALADNAAFDIPSGDRASFLGKIAISAPVDEGSTLYIENNNLNKPVKLSGTHIFGYLVSVGGYTPASASVLKVTLNAIQL